MKMIVKTTITSTFDVDSNSTSHTVDIDDEDGLAEVHMDVLGAVVYGGLKASEKAVLRKFPGIAAMPSAQSDTGD